MATRIDEIVVSGPIGGRVIEELAAEGVFDRFPPKQLEKIYAFYDFDLDQDREKRDQLVNILEDKNVSYRTWPRWDFTEEEIRLARWVNVGVNAAAGVEADETKRKVVGTGNKLSYSGHVHLLDPPPDIPLCSPGSGEWLVDIDSCKIRSSPELKLKKVKGGSEWTGWREIASAHVFPPMLQATTCVVCEARPETREYEGYGVDPCQLLSICYNSKDVLDLPDDVAFSIERSGKTIANEYVQFVATPMLFLRGEVAAALYGLDGFRLSVVKCID